MTQSPDVIVIGAGIAGLTAARDLCAAGARVMIVEARERVGGRIHTDQSLGYPVELGAEFIHGRPREIFDLVEKFGLPVVEVEGAFCEHRDGKWMQAGELWAQIESLFSKIPTNGPDKSFLEFLNYVEADEKVKQRALGFVEGFHAADPSRVSAHSIARSNAAEKAVDADSQFRLARGYDGLVRCVAESIDKRRCNLLLGTAVTQILWKPGEVRVKTDASTEFVAARAVITLPLGVLKSGTVRFTPELPAEKQRSLNGLEMGPVIRASLTFHDKFWAERPGLKDLSFLFTDDQRFPTWWTSNSLPYPLITGWAAGHFAQNLSGCGRECVVSRALETLAEIFALDANALRQQLASGFSHDWQSDPFSRGAYSYVLRGANNAENGLAAPVSNTLFFAGEATDSRGHNGTVHGAIFSGARVAREILAR